MMRLHWLIAIAACLLVTPPARATQHLVTPGDDWSRLDIEAGDEVILMPGEHRPGFLTGLRGGRKKIVIRGVRPDLTSIIAGVRYGLVLTDCNNVEVRDLVIRGATVYGIHAKGPEGGESESIQVRHVRVERTGPQGRRQGIRLERIKGANFLDCVVDGWGDSGLELVACRSIVVSKCVFQGRPGFSQISGIRARAGTTAVQINRCQFLDAGDQGVCAGGDSKPDDFLTPPTPKSAKGPLYECSGISVTTSVFRGGNCAIGIVSTNDIAVFNCAVVAPKFAIISFRRETADSRFGVLGEGVFNGNIITWPQGTLSSLAHVVRADPAPMIIQDNLWWTPDWEEQRERLGPWPGTLLNGMEQTIGDPLLDADFRPHAAIATGYGPSEVLTESAGVGPGD